MFYFVMLLYYIIQREVVILPGSRLYLPNQIIE